MNEPKYKAKPSKPKKRKISTELRSSDKGGAFGRDMSSARGKPSKGGAGKPSKPSARGGKKGGRR